MTVESSKEIKKNQEKSIKQKKKRNFVLISYLISCIGFAFAIIICSINGGQLDYDITRTIDNAHELDGLGAFMAPDFWTKEFWISGNIGQLPAFVLCIVGLLLLILSATQLRK